jgi:hypothetical protein
LLNMDFLLRGNKPHLKFYMKKGVLLVHRMVPKLMDSSA